MPLKSIAKKRLILYYLSNEQKIQKYYGNANKGTIKHPLM